MKNINDLHIIGNNALLVNDSFKDMLKDAGFEVYRGTYCTRDKEFPNKEYIKAGHQNIFLVYADASGNILWRTQDSVIIDILDILRYGRGTGRSCTADRPVGLACPYIPSKCCWDCWDANHFPCGDARGGCMYVNENGKEGNCHHLYLDGDKFDPTKA